MNAPLHQYAKSTDPDILAAVTAYWEAVAAARGNAIDFADKYGNGLGIYAGIRHGQYVASGIAGDRPKGHGQWKRLGHGWGPYKRNPIHAEHAALTVDLPPIPGLPKTVWGDGYIGSPQAFIHDGAAWYGIGFTPKPEYEADPRWEEVRVSEYNAALDAHNASVATPQEDER